MFRAMSGQDIRGGHYISRRKVLTHRTLLRTQAASLLRSNGVPQTSNYVAWPAEYFIRRFKTLLLNCPGELLCAAPLTFWVLGVYGEEGLDWNEAGSGSNFCLAAVLLCLSHTLLWQHGV